MYSVCQDIASAIFDASERNGAYPHPRDIRAVEFRRGCAQIEVTYTLDDEGDAETAVIDAEPILSAMLTRMIQEEQREY